MIDGVSVREGLTITGLGLSVIALVAWWMASMVRQAVKRSSTEGSLDDRVASILKTMADSYGTSAASVEGAYQKIIDVQSTTIDALRIRLEKIQDDLSAAYKTISTQQDQHHVTMLSTVSKLEERNLASAQRLHDRLDKTEEAHRACETRLANQGAEITSLRDLIRASTAGSSFILQPGSSMQVGSAPAAPTS